MRWLIFGSPPINSVSDVKTFDMFTKFAANFRVLKLETLNFRPDTPQGHPENKNSGFLRFKQSKNRGS